MFQRLANARLALGLSLTLGTSLAALANAAALLVLLSRRLNGLHGAHLASVTLRTLVAGTAMAAAAWGVEHALAGLLPGPALGWRAIRVGASIAAGLATLGVAARAVGITELGQVASALAARVRGSRDDV